MYSKSGYGVNAYASVGLETGVLAATPHKLILMLFQGAHVALSSALVHMKNGDITGKGEALSKPSRSLTRASRPALMSRQGENWHGS